MTPLKEYRRFSPSALGTLLTASAAALFVSLGLWQLNRADEKRALLAQAETGARSVVQASAESANTLPRYQQVSLRGRYDSGRQVLLDSMFSPQGRPGYRVLTPFALDSGGWILVDRGWIAPGRTRKDLPAVTVDEAPRTVIGRLDRLPQPGLRLAETSNPGSGWPRVLNFPTHAQLESALDRELADRLVLLDHAQPDGYERPERPLLQVDPGRHIGYAVQWFAFAAVALIIYFITSRKAASPSEQRTADSGQ